jgi:hypothetical protein
MRRVLAVLAVLMGASVAHAQTGLNFYGVYTEDFNSLTKTGRRGIHYPPGWYVSEWGWESDGAYAVFPFSWSQNNFNTYSFGNLLNNGEPSPNRSLGRYVNPDDKTSRNSLWRVDFRLNLTNRTGQTLTGLLVSYRGKQWLNGIGEDKIEFSYATDPEVGMVRDNRFDFTSMVAGGTNHPQKLNGDLVSRQITHMITLSRPIQPNDNLFFAWTGGGRDGLAIDDVVIVGVANGRMVAGGRR